MSRAARIAVSLAMAATVAGIAPAVALAAPEDAIVSEDALGVLAGDETGEKDDEVVVTDGGDDETPATPGDDVTDPAPDEGDEADPTDPDDPGTVEDPGGPGAADDPDADDPDDVEDPDDTDDPDDPDVGDPVIDETYTGWVDENGEPCDAADAYRWADFGVVATSKFFYDPSTEGWYWTEADGSIARNHDAYVPLSNDVDRELWLTSDEYRIANGKWVRLGADGIMVKGESYVAKTDAWYYFDEVTGAMQYGFRFVPSNGGKWVFYDYVTGVMAHGERYVDDSHGDEPGWMYFDPYTGAVDYGWAYLPDSDKWVYYDPVSGRMWYGNRWIDGNPYYLDPATGKKLTKDEMVSRLLSVAASQDGISSGDKYVNALVSAGGVYNPMGPCMTYVWWCFHECGFDLQLMDGTISSKPHEVEAWYRQRGRIMQDPQPGDIWLVNQPSHGWQYIGRVSATHAALVDHVTYRADGSVDKVYAWQHVNGWVHLVEEDPYNVVGGWLVGYARPNFNE